MSTFIPGDRVLVTDKSDRYAGMPGAVVELTLGLVLVRLDVMPTIGWLAFYPDELVLDLAREGHTVLASGGGRYLPVAFVPGRPLPSRRTVTLTVGDVWAWNEPIAYTLTNAGEVAA